MSKKLDLRELKADAEKEPAAVDAPKERFEVVSREIDFTITYDAPDGNTYNESLRSRVLDGDGRITKTRIFNRLTAGMIVTNLPQNEELRLEAISRVMAQLVEMPNWVAEWIGQDNDLLASLNAILVEHESRYFRGNSEKGEAGEVKSRISVNNPFST
jgi:hypothetical protein